MASYNELLALIDAYINQNGVQAITGQVLNGVLRAMVDQLGRGYSIMGAADPTTDPGTPDGPETWFASVPGTYTNFDGIQIVPGELALLSYEPSTGFSKNTIYEGFQTVQATIDGNVGTPAVGVSYANGILSFDFHNMKGVTGDPAGFGAVTASVDSNIGTPSVQVQTSGPDTAKAIAFQFHNLKGETGVTSVLATVDNTSGNPQCSVSLNGQQLVLNFTGLKGAQGDTGSSVDYPFTIVNNLTTNDPAQALSAAMGVQLESEVSQLEAEVTDIDSVLGYEGTPVSAFSAFNALNNSNADLSVSPFIVSLRKTSVIINKIKLNVVSTGTLTIGKIRKDEVVSGVLYDATKVYAKRQVVLSSTGVQEVYFASLFVQDYELVTIGESTDGASFKYGSNGTDHDFFYISSGTGKFSISNNCIGVDFYGVEYTTDASRMIAESIKKSAYLQTIFGESIEDVTLYKGFGDGDSPNPSTPANSPFVPKKSISGRGIVTGIKLVCYTGGTLSIGKIKKSLVVSGNYYDRDDVSVLATTNIVPGVNFIPLNLVIEEDEYITIGMPSDTGVFKYGTHTSIDSGFIYFNPNGKYVSTDNSLGIDIYVTQIEEEQTSIYRGKRLSILGDSISTYSGWIPAGNETYYPHGTVQSVQDTWWKKLIDALGFVLDTNNSWSGSRVTTTGGETSAGCMTRCQNLGTPDVVIVWMGINDFNGEVPLGTYDGMSSVPSVTTTFREAYGIMLDKILTAYKNAEVWVCTLPQCERNASTGFPEINADGVCLEQYNKAIRELASAFGVRVLEHALCGLTYQNMSVYNPDQLHPTKGGHSLVANNDIRQMDNAVRKRY